MKMKIRPTDNIRRWFHTFGGNWPQTNKTKGSYFKNGSLTETHHLKRDWTLSVFPPLITRSIGGAPIGGARIQPTATWSACLNAFYPSRDKGHTHLKSNIFADFTILLLQPILLHPSPTMVLCLLRPEYHYYYYDCHSAVATPLQPSDDGPPSWTWVHKSGRRSKGPDDPLLPLQAAWVEETLTLIPTKQI